MVVLLRRRRERIDSVAVDESDNLTWPRCGWSPQQGYGGGRAGPDQRPTERALVSQGAVSLADYYAVDEPEAGRIMSVKDAERSDRPVNKMESAAPDSEQRRRFSSICHTHTSSADAGRGTYP